MGANRNFAKDGESAATPVGASTGATSGSGQDGNQAKRAEEQVGSLSSKQEAELKESSESTVKVQVNPELVGYGTTEVHLSSGDVVSANKPREISQEAFDAGDTDQTGRLQLVVEA